MRRIERKAFHFAAAADCVDTWLWRADADYEVLSVHKNQTVIGSDGGAVTLMLEKVPSGTAIGSGTDILSATMNLKSTADAEVAGSLAAGASRRIPKGQWLCADFTGTQTGVAGLGVTVVLIRTGDEPRNSGF